MVSTPPSGRLFFAGLRRGAGVRNCECWTASMMPAAVALIRLRLAWCSHSTQWLHREHDVLAPTPRKKQGRLDLISRLEIATGADEHQVDGARLELDDATGRHRNAISQLAHLHGAAVHAHLVDFDARGRIAAGRHQAIRGCTGVAQRQVAAGNACVRRRRADPRAFGMQGAGGGGAAVLPQALPASARTTIAAKWPTRGKKVKRLTITSRPPWCPTA